MKRHPLTRHAKRAVQWLMAALLTSCAFGPGAYSQKQAPRRAPTEPFTMREDFQGGGLGQWASYPPVQDIGYEPSLSPTAEYGAPGGRALMRIVQPTRPGSLRFGFIKRVRLVTSENSRLSFVYRLRRPAPGDRLEIGLAGRDGRRYTAQVPVSAEDRWAKVDLALAGLRDGGGRALGAGLGVEAIYLVANIADADPDQTYRYIIDDVTFTAARESRWEVKLPEAVTIDPWEALDGAAGYQLGDTIRVKAASTLR